MANENNIIQPSQRRFSVMGANAFKMANKIITNQRICRLLKYSVRDPFSSKYPDIVGEDLIGNQVSLIPKIPDEDNWKVSYIVAVFDNFIVNTFNPEFKISTIRFDISCPYEEWMLDDNSLRPYLIMQEIDSMFNKTKMSGIGELQFLRAYALTLTPQSGGYGMVYQINEFN